MSRWDNPSFSSTLLDKIYRSIDEGERSHEDTRFYSATTTMAAKKQSGRNSRATEEEEDMAALRRACLIEKWIEKKAMEKEEEQRRQRQADLDRNRNFYHDHDEKFFSSNSCSSDSSSGGFSSSDAESMYGSRSSRGSCFAPSLWPKPIRTRVQSGSSKTDEKKQRTLFREQRELHMFDDYHYNRVPDQTTKVDEGMTKSKSRALKIYDNLKKVKQPISPGGKVANFLNSLFTAGQNKRSVRSTSSVSGYEEANFERKLKSGPSSTCSSASSFSRSCLSKNSPNTRHKLRNGVKKSVQFYPVSVIVGEDCRPCGEKCLYEEHDASLMPVTVPTAWKIGRSQSRKDEEVIKQRVLEKSRQAEEAAREFLKDHRRNQALNNELLVGRDYNNHNDDLEDEDDAMSCSSSDLFELDHLTVLGKDRYLEELPVYETTRTTRFGTNRVLMA